MNETYLTILGIVFGYLIFQFFVIPDFADGGDLRVISTIIILISFFFGLIISEVAPLGDSIVEIKQATNTRVGDQLVIQSEGFPTQIVTDIGLVDKEVQIRKTTPKNSWGGKLQESYTVEKTK